GIGVRKGDRTLLGTLNRVVDELLADGTLERIYSKYGLWDQNQEQLKSYREVPAETAQQWARHSTLRNWPRYLPLLLRGALVTIQISCLSMILAVAFGLILSLTRLYGIVLMRWLAVAYIE